MSVIAPDVEIPTGIHGANHTTLNTQVCDINYTRTVKVNYRNCLSRTYNSQMSSEDISYRKVDLSNLANVSGIAMYPFGYAVKLPNMQTCCIWYSVNEMMSYTFGIACICNQWSDSAGSRRLCRTGSRTFVRSGKRLAIPSYCQCPFVT